MSDMNWPLNCAETRDFLLARFPGEAMPAAVREHLEQCSVCRREAELLERLDSKLHDAVGVVAAPPGLWHSIAAAIAEDGMKAVPRRARWWRVGSWSTPRRRIVAIGAAVVIAVLAAEGSWWRNVTELPVQVEPVDDFITFRMSGRALDLLSDNPAMVASWFAGKTDFALPPVARTIAGYELKGTRLCYFLNRRLAALAYAKDDRLFTLYVMSSANLDLPDGVSAHLAEGKISSVTLRGYRNLVWRQGDTVYALVSKLSAEELAEITDALRTAIRGAKAAVERPNSKT